MAVTIRSKGYTLSGEMTPEKVDQLDRMLAILFEDKGDIRHVGTITEGIWHGTVIEPAYGGTGLSSYIVGDLIVATAATTLATLPAVAAGRVLRSAGAATLPAYSTFTIPDTFVLGDILYASAANTLTALAGNTTSTQKFLSQMGNGSISAAPSWQVVPAVGSLVFFFYNTASDIGGGYLVMKTPASVGASQTIVSGSLGVSTTLLASFATLSGVPNVTFVPAGVCTCYVTASHTGTKGVQLFAEFYQRNLAGTETLLCTSAFSPDTTAIDAAYIFQGAIPSSLVFLATDRLVTKIWASVTGGGSSAVVTLTIEGVTAARSESPSATVDATNFVPYSGATADVNLGTKILTVPTVVGGTAVGSILELRATSGVGVGAEYVQITGGTNGGTQIARFTTALISLNSVFFDNAFGSHQFAAAGTGFNTFALSNATAGTGNGAQLVMGTDALNNFVIQAFSSTYTPSGYAFADGGALVNPGAGGLSFAQTGTGDIRFYTTGANVLRMKIATGGVVSTTSNLWVNNAIIGALGTVQTGTVDRSGLVVLTPSVDAYWQVYYDGTSFVNSATYISSEGYKPISFWTNDVERMRLLTGGYNLGIGVTAPTAVLHLRAGTATANTAPLKLNAGTLLTTPELGAIEFTDDGTTAHLYVTVRIATVVTRVQLA